MKKNLCFTCYNNAVFVQFIIPENRECRNMIQQFDTEFPEFTEMRSTKKFDVILWANV